MLLAINTSVFADVPVTSTTDMASTYSMSAVRVDSLQSLQSLITSVNKAQNVQNQITALQNLNDFSKDPVNATSQVNSVVGDMLNNFNMRSGTSFGNLQDLIGSLSSSTTATGMSLKLQQSSATQLQNISVLLQQMEAENQAVLKYKRAEEALKVHQAAAWEAEQKKTSASLQNM